jgi:hypothetical protein
MTSSQLLQVKDDPDTTMSGVNMTSLPISSNNSASRKRKAPKDLSENPNTVKARKRNEKLAQDPIRNKVEKAKAADQSAITVAKRKLVKSQEYINASEEMQREMVKNSAKGVQLKRYLLFDFILIFILICF